MSNVSITERFNSLGADLTGLQQFVSTVQAGAITVNTDGQGNYWVVIPQYTSLDVGSSTTNAVIDLDISAISSAQTAMNALQAILQGATVAVHP